MKSRFCCLTLVVGIALMMSSCSSSKQYSDSGRSYSKQRAKRVKSAEATGEYLELEASVSDKKFITKYKKPTELKRKSPNNYSRKNQKVSTEDSIREMIYETASQYLGLKYRSGGRTPSSGFDCSGFVAYVMGEHNIKIGGSSISMSKLGDLRNREELKVGDLIFFGKNGNIHHVGIVARNEDNELEMIHSASSIGISIDVIDNSKYWSSRFMYGRDIVTSYLLNGKLQ